MEVSETFDHSDPGPQAVKIGNLHTLTVQCYVPDGVTPEQIAEFIRYELGSGGLAGDHPLLNSGVEVRKVFHQRDECLIGYTLWDANGEKEPGKRHGYTIHREPGAPIDFEYQKPE